MEAVIVVHPTIRPFCAIIFVFPVDQEPMNSVSPFVAPAAGNLRHREKVSTTRWGNLPESALPIAIHAAAGRFDGLTVVVARDTASSYRIAQGLDFYRLDADYPLWHFPDWETLPYDNFSPVAHIISKRLQILHKISYCHRGVLLATVAALLHRLAPRRWLVGQAFDFKVGHHFELDFERQKLIDNSYRCVDIVREHGEFAQRGSLVDIFPTGSEMPLRLDLLDHRIDSLRTFDPETQRTIDRITSIQLLPAREFPLTDTAVEKFLDNWERLFPDASRKSEVRQAIRQGQAPPGIEYYLPLFFDSTDSLLDYLPGKVQFVLCSGVGDAAQEFRARFKERYENFSNDFHRPILPPEQLLIGTESIFSRLNDKPHINVQVAPLKSVSGQNFNYATQPIPKIAFDYHSHAPGSTLQRFLDSYRGRVLFCVASPGRQEIIRKLLKSIAIELTSYDDFSAFFNAGQRFGLTVGEIDDSLLLDEPEILILTESQLFGTPSARRRKDSRRQQSLEQMVHNLTELQPGDPVVHLDYGIGRYQGLEVVNHEQQAPTEFVVIRYADDARLYVPVTSLHLLNRYNGAGAAPLHGLNSGQWEKARSNAARQIHDVASDLLEIYARRASSQGFRFRMVDENSFRRFESQFPFEETPDQQKAVENVIDDMLSERAMDRLICGDVGFGKTEIAMRAAFLAVLNTRQVAILVPTTLLARQHYKTFQDRFADWPVTIEELSRMQSGARKKQLLEHLADGRIDIIIGTHSLLQRNVRFKSLGLVVIDEEHRFGVRHKERLKSLRVEADVLTLTATPIPRTLNLAMSGLRDLSLVSTPPAERLSIKTFVRQQNWNLVCEAIQRELLRGGQVYFLHHEIRSIDQIAGSLQESFPQARIGTGHGQMRERELERVMTDFYRRRIDILVCTTIIESGIDVANANTIIIYRADKFGLAQLHQLRGRVGRSFHQAYAYLLTPPGQSITRNAMLRLKAIIDAGELGLGFILATHDLEIRGAGELLGNEQTGQIQEIGFELYQDMLQRAILALRTETSINPDIPLSQETEVSLHIPALIPNDYLPDVSIRLVLYHRIAEARDDKALRELREEMIDRFGSLPIQSQYLFRTAALKNRAKRLKISCIDLGANGGFVEFSDQTTVEPEAIIRLVQLHARVFRLARNNRLLIREELVDVEGRFARAREILDYLEPGNTAD